MSREDNHIRYDIANMAADSTKIHQPAHHTHSDSDSDDDHEFYGNPESNIAAFAKDSVKHAASIRDGRLGSVAADSLKVQQPVAHHEHHSAFSFHNFGFHATPFTDIMNSINTMRNSYNEAQAAYDAQNKPKKTKKRNKDGSKEGPKMFFDIKEFQKTQANTKTNKKISQFRETALKWDLSAPDEQLLKALYRTAESDPSGKRIFNLARDEAKGATPWKPTEADRDLEVPPISTLSPSFQKMLLDHIDSVVARVEAEYAKMPAKTQAQSEIKAGVGADLANLRRRQQELHSQAGSNKKAEV
jgi:hypothetical protein